MVANSRPSCFPRLTHIYAPVHYFVEFFNSLQIGPWCWPWQLSASSSIQQLQPSSEWPRKFDASFWSLWLYCCILFAVKQVTLMACNSMLLRSNVQKEFSGSTLPHALFLSQYKKKGEKEKTELRMTRCYKLIVWTFEICCFETAVLLSSLSLSGQVYILAKHSATQSYKEAPWEVLDPRPSIKLDGWREGWMDR